MNSASKRSRNLVGGHDGKNLASVLPTTLSLSAVQDDPGMFTPYIAVQGVA